MKTFRVFFPDNTNLDVKGHRMVLVDGVLQIARDEDAIALFPLSKIDGCLDVTDSEPEN